MTITDEPLEKLKVIGATLSTIGRAMSKVEPEERDEDLALLISSLGEDVKQIVSNADESKNQFQLINRQ